MGYHWAEYFYSSSYYCMDDIQLCASQQSKLSCPGVWRLWGETCSNSIPSRVAVDTWDSPSSRDRLFWMGSHYLSLSLDWCTIRVGVFLDLQFLFKEQAAIVSRKFFVWVLLQMQLFPNHDSPYSHTCLGYLVNRLTIRTIQGCS